VIERVEVERVSLRGEWRDEGEVVTLYVRDADGWGDVTGLTLTDSVGQDWTLTPSGYGEWKPEATDLMRVRVDLGHLVGEWKGGWYGVEVSDAAGLTDGLIAPSAPPVPGPVPTFNLPTQEPSPVFSWTPGEAGREYTLVVHRGTLAGPEIWSYPVGTATSIQYNVDGKAAEGGLLPGDVYGLELFSRKCEDCGASDPRVWVYTLAGVTAEFSLNSPSPVIVGMGLMLETEEEGAGWAFCQGRVDLCFSSFQPYDPANSVTIVGPDGDVHAFDESAFRGMSNGQYVVSLQLERTLGARNLGPYKATFSDSGGVRSTFTMPEVVPPGQIKLLWPPPEGLIYDSRPTFEWSIEGDPPVAFDLWEEGRSTPLWSVPIAPGGGLPYDYNHTAAEPELAPGHSYVWRVRYWSTSEVAPRVALDNWQEAYGRFQVSGPISASPQLRGKLVYGTYSSWDSVPMAVAYTPSAAVPAWMGPAYAEFPDWSPDGSRLVLMNGLEFWVAGADGSPEDKIPGQMGLDCRWSPDGTRIVYSRTGYWGPAGLWVSRLDGADAHPLVSDPALTGRYPDWSPDGQWIAYRLDQDANGQCLQLVRADGTESRRVLATEVAGYPGYQISYLGNSAWCPDGGRLAVYFEAEGPVGPPVWGLGVISKEGGQVKPIFLAPPGVVCCAAPNLPRWSPEGTKIVFSSAHHLPPNPAWPWGEFEPGVELWMINADGSGEPVRLTYDYSYDAFVSWWAPPYFPDVRPGHWAYCAVSTCYERGIVSGFPDGTYQPGLPVTREQMAVYVSRGIAGGDANMPTGPALPSFSDVPADHWAYRHIEYAKANAVVEGYPDGSYRPTLTLDRGQMAVFIARSLVTPSGEAAIPDPVPPSHFPDVTPESAWSWCHKHVEYVASRDIVRGYPDGLYHPEYACTRDQMAVYVARAFELPM
jgi:hypothetical protein